MSERQRRLKKSRVGPLLAASALVLLVSGPAPSPTEANWVDPEYASANVTALTVPSLRRPTCVTEQVGSIRRRIAHLNWTPPTGELPNGMLYEIRTTNITDGSFKSIFRRKGETSYTYADRLGDGTDFGKSTTLKVQVFVVIPNSTDKPTSAVWESPTPETLTLTYTYLDVSRGSYRCPGD